MEKKHEGQYEKDWVDMVRRGLIHDVEAGEKIRKGQPECMMAGQDREDMEELERYLGSVGQEEYYDNISGDWLDPHMVKEAREVEMDDVHKHKVYEKVPLEECYKERGVAPIGIRWVDTNKGDRVHPEYRSILVAQEINMNKREDLFAATPPLEAKKILFYKRRTSVNATTCTLATRICMIEVSACLTWAGVVIWYCALLCDHVRSAEADMELSPRC